MDEKNINNTDIDEKIIEEWQEDDTKELDEIKDQPVQSLSDSQLRIIRTNIDYNLDFLKQSLGKNINLSPQYQRRSRWNNLKKSLLIESLLLNVPIPPIFLFETEYYEYEVVDGRQRLEAITDFLEDKFALKGLHFWNQLNTLKFSKLPLEFQRGLMRRTISATVLLAESTNTREDIDVRMLLFDRLNTGGVQLNAQELRNALYSSPFNDMLFRLSQNDLFTKIWKIPKRITDGSPAEIKKNQKLLDNNPLYKTMTDCELVLRFYAIREIYLHDIKGSLKDLQDRTMKKYSKYSKDEVDSLEFMFQSCINAMFNIFGDRAFVLPTKSIPARNLYDSLMVAYSEIDPADIDNTKNIETKLQKLLDQEEEYEKIITKGNSIEMIKYRVDKAKEVLQK